MNGRDNNEEKGLLWKLPSVNSKNLGKLGPAFGIGVGCGVGFGVGLVGGTWVYISYISVYMYPCACVSGICLLRSLRELVT